MLLQRPDEDALLPLFLFPRHLNHYSQITILSSSPPPPPLQNVSLSPAALPTSYSFYGVLGAAAPSRSGSNELASEEICCPSRWMGCEQGRGLLIANDARGALPPHPLGDTGSPHTEVYSGNERLWGRSSGGSQNSRS
jgi:hypothetical protein